MTSIRLGPVARSGAVRPAPAVELIHLCGHSDMVDVDDHFTQARRVVDRSLGVALPVDFVWLVHHPDVLFSTRAGVVDAATSGGRTPADAANDAFQATLSRHPATPQLVDYARRYLGGLLSLGVAHNPGEPDSSRLFLAALLRGCSVQRCVYLVTTRPWLDR